MFNPEFYPTPADVIQTMLAGEIIENKNVLEPSAGKGDIVDYLNEHHAKSVLTCEINADLQSILKTKSTFLTDDFLNVKSEQVSHIDLIVMNPPFSTADKHILHALNIMPKGCKVIALCNSDTIKHAYTNTRKELKNIIDTLGGTVTDLGQCFEQSERKTGVNVSMITIEKAGDNYNQEFQGFFMEEEPEEAGGNGILSYNVVRDLVNRYVAAVKLYDKQLDTGKQMNALLDNFYGEGLTFTCTEKGAPKLRTEFKKDLQRAGWRFIFEKMNLTKNTTQGLYEDINKFVEQQTEIPFTMRNIYHMLDIVMQTTGQRMDKAIIEVFDKVTAHHHDNRYHVKGWKTNSHFLVGKKFILPNIISPAKEYGYTSDYYTSLRDSYHGRIPDLEKALCYVTGKDYDKITTINHSINRNIYGDWFNSEFFKYKGYKNGNMHFEFMDTTVWELFNQRVAKIKGYVLFEAKEQTDYQKRQTGRDFKKEPAKKAAAKPTEAKVLFNIKIK